MNQLKTAKDVKWTEPAKKNFEELKQCFVTAPIRGFPMYYSSKPFLLSVQYGCYIVAKTRWQGEISRVCWREMQCCRKQLFQNQRRISSRSSGIEKIWTHSACQTLVLRTDSKSVENLQTMKEVRGIYARWQNLIGSFQFSITHRAGTAQ